ncbi:MAG: hypothetical protein A3K08_01245 [Candidatus Doudnabacteria bacterium RIFCSPLOWO2_01_41_7]|nr:MAG: hypothetical protein A3K08_01245 [Candidatus Doudnabacteria bacterium RIFCSPLOWO2_01_41_7]
MTKNHRDGEKFGGNHTTLLDLAVTMVDIAAKYSEVNTISPGMLQVNPNKSGGSQRVKFAWMKGGGFL